MLTGNDGVNIEVYDPIPLKLSPEKLLRDLLREYPCFLASCLICASVFIQLSSSKPLDLQERIIQHWHILPRHS